MILHLGEVLKNENNEEYVERFYYFNFPKIRQFNHEYVLDETINAYFFEVLYADDLPEDAPTDIVSILKSHSTTETEDYSDLIGRKFNFFTLASISEKLNFSVYVCDYRNNNFYLHIGDITRGIGFKVVVNKDSPCYLLINPSYSDSSIEVLLEETKTKELNNFNRQDYLKFFNIPSLAPFYVYVKSIFDDTLSSFNLRWQGDTPYMRSTFAKTQNLSRWSNWYTMINGTYSYGTPFFIDLEEETRGIKRIELSTSYYDVVGYDEGKEFITEYDSKEFNTIGFSNYYAGTDLSYLFNIDDYYWSGEKTLYTTYGYIKLIRESQYDDFELEIVSGGEGIKWNIGKITIFSSNYNSFYDADNQNADQHILGVYLGVTPKFSQILVSRWLNQIADDYDNYEYDNNPFYIASYGFRNLETNYVEEEIEEQPGFAMNYANADGRNIYYNDTQYPDKALPISKEFFKVFFEGFIIPPTHPNIGSGSLGGGYSDGRGGTGKFDDSSDTISNIGSIVKIQPDLNIDRGCNIHALTNVAAMSKLFEALWDTDWSFEDFKIFGDTTDPSTSIVSCKYFPLSTNKLYNTEGQIRVGGKNLSVDSSDIFIVNDKLVYDFGDLDIEEYFGSYLDYTETKINIILPYSGIYELDTNQIMGGKINLTGYIDFITGQITYYITLTKNNIKNVYDSFQGNVGYDIQISSRDAIGHTNQILKQAITSSLSGAISGGISGGGAGALMGVAGGMMNALNTSITTNPTINKSGSFTGDRFSIAIPMLMITRPKQNVPETFGEQFGYPSNISVELGNIEGFTVVKDIQPKEIGDASKSEIDEIINLLKSGVVI